MVTVYKFHQLLKRIEDQKRKLRIMLYWYGISEGGRGQAKGKRKQKRQHIRNRLTDIENKLMVTKGVSRGGGR